MLIDRFQGEPVRDSSPDVLIIGAGPSGLALAHELIGSGLSVCVLEAGTASAGWEALPTLEPGGFTAAPNDASRASGVGGTAARWNTFVDRREAWARLVEMNGRDFAPNALRPGLSWPLEFSEVASYYPRAYALAGVHPWARQDDARLHPLALPGLRTDMQPFVRARHFTHVLGDRLATDPAVQLIRGARVTSLQTTSEGRRVSAVEAVDPTGATTRFVARRVVLATGGIENVRLLMIAGYEHPALGRYFSDHHQIALGTLEIADRSQLARLRAYDIVRLKSAYFMGKLQFEQQVRDEASLLNSAMHFGPTLRKVESTRDRLRLGVAAATLAVRQRTLIPKLGAGGWATLPFVESILGEFGVIAQVEQAPHPENRVVLGHGRDCFGLPRVRVISQLRECDLVSIAGTRDRFASAVEDAGLGTMTATSEVPGTVSVWYGMHHHACTTRMDDDPGAGVVDRDSRVHGTTNLYCTGSSVFPTGGYANPLLTQLALAIRLGDHLKELR